MDRCDATEGIRTRIPRMDWASRTEGPGNAGEIANSFFHPSGPSEFGYLIQHKCMILKSKLARGAGRTPFHPVNPGRNPWENVDFYFHPPSGYAFAGSDLATR
jgi:hypothetical protein